MLASAICLRRLKSLLSQPSAARASVREAYLHTSAVAQRQPSTPSRKHHPYKPGENALPFNAFQKAFPMARRPDNVTFKHTQDIDYVRKRLALSVERWTSSPQIKARLASMGFDEPTSSFLLKSFRTSAPSQGWFPPEEDSIWGMELIHRTMLANPQSAVDRALTRRLLSWIRSNPERFDNNVVTTVAALMDATNFSHPSEWYPAARRMKRKIVMHVGPTNSGKTHNALRALAGARAGVYAGPLRLLAVEIFDRFNKGLILPLGIPENALPEDYKRVCNLLTGEDIRMVDEDAGLTSCTVEMLSFQTVYDVAVIDEIQMITDTDRGGAWTAAVLGVCSKELHLCGEETVVPLIQKMLKGTGDDIVVNRYERLTPLVMASKSLNGKLNAIEKGDCVVAFSRGRIFSLKKTIEEQSGRRCAVVYGRLPPEVRSEQAELFNNPESDYDVLVGSDALGMGLNLRVKRIIFDSASKWDGTRESRLSVSQIKQIAGRAGRFGMHSVDACGIVTTLHEEDMDYVRKALAAPLVTHSIRATLPQTIEKHRAVEQLLKQPSSFASVFDIQSHLSNFDDCYITRDIPIGTQAAITIDELCQTLTLNERLLVFNSPVQWRDEVVSSAMVHFLRMYRDELHVDLRKTLDALGLLEDLDTVTELQQNGPRDHPTSKIVNSLESVYRVLVLYKWFHNRLPLVFCDGDVATQLKTLTEESIEWCLARLREEKSQHHKGIEHRWSHPSRTPLRHKNANARGHVSH